MTDIVFETERLRVTLWRDDHAGAAFPAYSDSNFTRGLGASRMHDTIDDTREWIGRIRKMYDDRGPERGFWAVERQDTGEAVGATMCQPLPDGDGEHEIGWHVFPAHQHNGYATESGGGRWGDGVVRVRRARARRGLRRRRQHERAVPCRCPTSRHAASRLDEQVLR